MGVSRFTVENDEPSLTMKIGIDVRMVQNFPTGIGNYRENLIRALAKLPSTHKFVLVGNAGNKMENWVEGKRQFEFRTVRSKPNSLHQHLLLPFEIHQLNLDLFWTTPWGASVFLWQKYALTIYDLLYRRYPKIASPKARLYDLLVSKWVARRAEVIFTISKFVKNDIKRFLGIKGNKITNISGAAGSAYRPFSDSDSKSFAFVKHKITKPFFVYLGNFRPHKNLATLLQAFSTIRGRRSEIGSQSPKLVLIGDVDARGREQDSKNLLEQIEKLGLGGEVILTGRIEDDREVAAILNEAVALVHPSFHEGFGLTVLEAMSCGCPVIAANATSVPEVVGEAGILVDPHNVDEIVAAMNKILHSNTAQYQSWVQKGLEQAKKFSWQKTAKQVLNTIKSTQINPRG